MLVRKLGGADVAGMRGANALFADAFAEPKTYLGHQPPDEYLRAWLASPAHVMLVTEDNGRVIGALAAYVLEKFEQARSSGASIADAAPSSLVLAQIIERESSHTRER